MTNTNLTLDSLEARAREIRSAVQLAVSSATKYAPLALGRELDRIILAALRQVREEDAPYMQHLPECESVAEGMRVGADCLWWRVGDEIVTRSAMDTFDKETRRPVECTCGLLAALRARTA